MTADELTIRGLNEYDIPAAERLTQAAGWNQTTAEWQRLIRSGDGGCLAAVLGGRLVGTVTTIQYRPGDGHSLAWIGMMLVAPEQRGQGVGTRLLQRAIAHLEDAGIDAIGLDATPMGQPLYEKAGFVPIWPLRRWQADALPQMASGHFVRCKPVATGDWPALADLDQRSFGVCRPQFLQALADQSVRVIVARDSTDTITGYGMVRAGAVAYQLGPLIAPSEQVAGNLLAALFTDLEPGPVFWDIPARNVAATQLATALQCRPVRRLTRMVRGGTFPLHEVQLLYGIADLAAG